MKIKVGNCGFGRVVLYTTRGQVEFIVSQNSLTSKQLKGKVSKKMMEEMKKFAKIILGLREEAKK